MPVTPLHFGPALAVRAIVGKKNFGICAFGVTQVAFDMEPAVRLFFDLDGTLHQTTHNFTFGLIYALLAIALCWRWERWSGIVGAAFGVVTHLWLDAMYHSDVAHIIQKYGVEQIASLSPTGTEILCALGFLVWFLVTGVRKSIQQRRGV